MCARPRTVSDEELLEATARAVSRVGPARLTLADVAREAGVVPATLVQRFGTKRGMLLALARLASGSERDQMAAIRAAHASPLRALYAVAECWAGMAKTPEELANHLSFLVIDLTDPEFHHFALAHARSFHAAMKGLLDDAVTAGELSACDTDGLARVVQETLQGSLVAWAIYREGRVGEWVCRDLEFLLSRYLGPKRRSRGQDAPRNTGAAASVRDHPARKRTARSQGSDESATS
ncbi:MAG: TetR/AcrR family transcriptional regulator [Isosphaeraceae bacterium]